MFQEKKENLIYKHTQRNPFFTFLFPASPIIYWLIMSHYNYGLFEKPLFLGIFIFIILIIGLFSSLTIKVDSEKISINLLCSRCKKNIYLKDIQSIKKVRNPWHYAWGIRILSPETIIINVYGLDAVEIKKKNKKIIIIGTNDSENLTETIKKTLKDLK